MKSSKLLKNMTLSTVFRIFGKVHECAMFPHRVYGFLMHAVKGDKVDGKICSSQTHWVEATLIEMSGREIQTF